MKYMEHLLGTQAKIQELGRGPKQVYKVEVYRQGAGGKSQKNSTEKVTSFIQGKGKKREREKKDAAET